MFIYLVDNTIDGQGASPRELEASLRKVAPEAKILKEVFHKVTPARIRELAPSHIILSGQSHPWADYAEDSLQGVFQMIRTAPQPILGVCGGHQQIGLAFGSAVGLMERLEPGEGYEGAKRERGFLPIRLSSSQIFQGLPDEIIVWHSHCDEVKELPPGFRVTASNSTCRIQAMEYRERPLFGVQFHPELFSDEHPDGRRIVQNFLTL